jgi:hypothetical protein
MDSCDSYESSSWCGVYHGAFGCLRHLHDLPGCPEPAMLDGWTAAAEDDVCVAVFLVQISLLDRDTQTEESVVGGCGMGPLVEGNEEEEEEEVDTSVRGAMTLSCAWGRYCVRKGMRGIAFMGYLWRYLAD